jgi:hypothetical protein
VPISAAFCAAFPLISMLISVLISALNYADFCCRFPLLISAAELY